MTVIVYEGDNRLGFSSVGFTINSTDGSDFIIAVIDGSNKDTITRCHLIPHLYGESPTLKADFSTVVVDHIENSFANLAGENLITENKDIVVSPFVRMLRFSSEKDKAAGNVILTTTARLLWCYYGQSKDISVQSIWIPNKDTGLLINERGRITFKIVPYNFFCTDYKISCLNNKFDIEYRLRYDGPYDYCYVYITRKELGSDTITLTATPIDGSDSITASATID